MYSMSHEVMAKVFVLLRTEAHACNFGAFI